MVRRANTPEDFWKLVDKTSDCWIYLGPKDQDGYGQFMVNRKNKRAHRYVKEITGNPIPLGKVSRHLCNNRACVNPEHIVAGTQKENIEDELRAKTFSKLKYSDELVATVKAEYIYGSSVQGSTALARKYGVSVSWVQNIVTNKIRKIY